ncbi:LUC7-like protein [Cordyceps javanica]|uniref:LUC7-like protein n=1 Tax=Cordyceps javanica TaxID=43265 RepID=A0A545VUA7_9HYPO|nr:LUC7-like protein [Cordyceps javanica]TQW05299.1 LUC7-like protein [Cordyceps javanica]
MSNEEILTDDYVAGLLSQEASDCSIKYSAMGVDAFLGKDSNSKKPMNIPKPNTRFLRNIIKGTDSHNKALLAKEAAESKARLRRLERAEEIKRKKSNPTTRDIRERHMGHIQAILGGGRRRSRDGDNNDKEPDSGERAQAKGKSRDHHHGDVSGDEDQEKLHRKCSAAGHQADDSRHHRSRRHDGRRGKTLEKIDPGLLEPDTDSRDPRVEMGSVDATVIARHQEIDRQLQLGMIRHEIHRLKKSALRRHLLFVAVVQSVRRRE